MHEFLTRMLSVCFSFLCICCGYTITINVPVVFMARYVMVLRSATSLRGALEAVGPENQDFWAQKIRHKNNWYIGSFMYSSAVVYCCSCIVWADIQGMGAGWQGSPSPSHYSVGIHGFLLVGGGRCSYIRWLYGVVLCILYSWYAFCCLYSERLILCT